MDLDAEIGTQLAPVFGLAFSPGTREARLLSGLLSIAGAGFEPATSGL